MAGLSTSPACRTGVRSAESDLLAHRDGLHPGSQRGGARGGCHPEHARCHAHRRAPGRSRRGTAARAATLRSRPRRIGRRDRHLAQDSTPRARGQSALAGVPTPAAGTLAPCRCPLRAAVGSAVACHVPRASPREVVYVSPQHLAQHCRRLPTPAGAPPGPASQSSSGPAGGVGHSVLGCRTKWKQNAIVVDLIL